VTGTPAAIISFLAASFSPIARIDCGRRADPDEPGRDHLLGELGILREEAIAGVDRLGAGRLGGGEDLVA
jgi:hypothetical protein